IIDPAKVETNLVFFEIDDQVTTRPAELIEQLDAKDVKIGHRYGRQFRACTHYWISETMVDKALAAFQEILKTN
ncbi:MAG: hypothetical protein JXA42_06765, partial [Anaerolineales bacterium]|nr:hypothetical protein [Anaerolineales bacterium]